MATTPSWQAPIPSVISETVSVTKIPDYFNITGKLALVNTFIPHKLAYLGGKQDPMACRVAMNLKAINYTKQRKQETVPKEGDQEESLTKG